MFAKYKFLYGPSVSIDILSKRWPSCSVENCGFQHTFRTITLLKNNACRRRRKKIVCEEKSSAHVYMLNLGVVLIRKNIEYFY